MAEDEQNTRERVSWAPTIKWIAIAVVVCVLAGFAYKAYQVATAPVRMVQDMGASVSSAGDAVKDRAGDMVNRLEMEPDDTKRLDTLSEAAFATLVEMPATDPKSMSDRMFRATHLRDNEGKVCKMSITFGDTPIPVYAAANNKTYATAKALGAKEDRIIRVHIVTGDEDIALRSYWSLETETWAMRWRLATLGKPISDQLAQDRLMDVLAAIPYECGIEKVKLPDVSSE